ncbi:hypothetical protein [Paraburkholderia sediminicola]
MAASHLGPCSGGVTGNPRASTPYNQSFVVPDDALNGYWVELHKTPKLAI